MLFIFGDSHADFNFRGLEEPNLNLQRPSITMHRVGRDGELINFRSEFCSPQNSFVLCYGEVDCRCHIGRQVEAGRALEEICNELVSAYFTTIRNRISTYNQIILCSITPPLRRREYEDIHGPITHEFPFVGTDEERVLYTKLMNKLLAEAAAKNGYKFMNLWNEYARPEDGTLKREYSDGVCHITQNAYILQSLKAILTE